MSALPLIHQISTVAQILHFLPRTKRSCALSACFGAKGPGQSCQPWKENASSLQPKGHLIKHECRLHWKAWNRFNLKESYLRGTEPTFSLSRPPPKEPCQVAILSLFYIWGNWSPKQLSDFFPPRILGSDTSQSSNPHQSYCPTPPLPFFTSLQSDPGQKMSKKWTALCFRPSINAMPLSLTCTGPKGRLRCRKSFCPRTGSGAFSYFNMRTAGSWNMDPMI